MICPECGNNLLRIYTKHGEHVYDECEECGFVIYPKEE